MKKILLSDIRDWLEEINHNADVNYYIGKLAENKEKCIGVYDRTDKTEEKIALGGYDNNAYHTRKVSILFHWNKNADETEKEAEELIEKIRTRIDNGEYEQIGTKNVYLIKIMTDGSVDVGRSNTGIYERVIWLDIFYE